MIAILGPRKRVSRKLKQAVRGRWFAPVASRARRGAAVESHCRPVGHVGGLAVYFVEAPVLTTLIDLAILVAVGFAIRAIAKFRARARQLSTAGFRAINSGLVLVASFFLLDLLTTWLLPALIETETPDALMTDWSLPWSWSVMFLGVVLLTTGIVAVARHIAKSERSLSAQADLFMSVVQHQNEFIVRWLPDGTRTFVNDAYCSYFQTPREELIGTSFFPLVAEQDLERVRNRIESLSAEEPSSQGTHRVVRPDGSEGWQQWTDHAFFDESGECVELQSVGRDVTQEKQIEEELRIREQQYRAVFRASPNGLTVRRMGDGELLAVNPAMAEMFGYTVEEFAKLSLKDYLHPDDLGRFPEMLAALDKGEVFPFAVKGIHRDGSTLHVDGHFLPFASGGERQILGTVRNVTGRKRAETEARRREMVLDSVFQALPDLFFLMDPDGTIRDYRAARTSDLYLPPERFLGKRMQDVLPPPVAGQFFQEITAASERSRWVTFEYALEIAGDQRQYEARLGRLPDSPQIVAVVRDITERKLAEEALRESESRLLKAESVAHMGFLSWDLKTDEIALSKEIHRIFGLRPGEIETASQLTQRAVHPEDLEMVGRHLKRAIAGDPLNLDHRVVHPDGEVRWVLAQAELIRDAEGNPQTLLGTAVDITERKRAEEALREGEQRMELALQGAELGTWDLNLESGDLTQNERGYEMLGYSPDEIEPRLSEWKKLVHPDDMPEVRERIKAHMEGKTDSYETVHRLRHKSGRWVWVLDKGRVIDRDAEGKPLRACGTHLDISELKQAETEIRESQSRLRDLADRLQQVREDERKTVAREIHDELGQVLTSLRIDLLWQADHLPEGTEELRRRSRSMIDIIDRTVDRVRALSAHLRPPILDDLGAAAAIEWYARDFSARTGIECDLHLETDLIDLNPAHGTAVFRIAQEALTNVARHAEADRVEIHLRATEAGLALRVVDNGKGISEEQSCATGSLGLLGMQERAAVLGGTLGVEKLSQGGTEVALYLPVETEGGD